MNTSSPPGEAEDDPTDREFIYPGAAQSEFDRIYLRATTVGYRIAMARLRNREDARDLVQTVCANLAKDWQANPAAFRDEAAIDEWVGTHIHMTGRNLKRGRKREDAAFDAYELEMQAFAYPWADPAAKAERHDALESLARAVDKMPRQQRKVWLMVHEGATAAEVAESLGVKAQTVWNHTSAAYDLLRRAMAAHRDESNTSEAKESK